MASSSRLLRSCCGKHSNMLSITNPSLLRSRQFYNTTTRLVRCCRRRGANNTRPYNLSPRDVISRTNGVNSTNGVLSVMLLTSTLFIASLPSPSTCSLEPRTAREARGRPPPIFPDSNEDEDYVEKKQPFRNAWRRYTKLLTREKLQETREKPQEQTKPSRKATVNKKESTREAAVSALKQEYEVSVCGLQGNRDYMEDKYFVGDGGRFVGVFDGHGGDGVAIVLQQRLYKAYVKALKKFGQHESSWLESLSNKSNALLSAFDEVEDAILEDDALESQGSTAVVVVMCCYGDKTTLMSANVGDSRAILSREGKAKELTHDHKITDEAEWHRIQSTGETIKWDDYSELYRVRNLSVARSIGDRFAKPVVSGEVEVKGLDVMADKDEFYVLASDGVWDVMSSQMVVDFVHSKLQKHDKKNVARLVAEESLARGSADNISCAIVWLK